MARYRHYLSLAAATFVRARQWNRARAVYARMLQEDPAARSPFLSEALQQIRQGNFDFAAGILAQGYEITPREQISERMAQICLATDTPDDMLKSMEACLEQALGADAEALSAEIRTTLETMTRKAEAKNIEDAVERQWRAGRQAARERGDAEGAAAEWANDPLMQVGQAQMGHVQTNPSQPAGTAPQAGARQRGQVGIALADEDEPDMPSQQGSAARSGNLRAGQGASSPVIPLWGEHEGAAQSPQNTRTTQDAQPAISGNTPIPPLLDPLARGKSAGSLIGGKSSLTDMMSIVKFTWKQAFRK